jgi:hypothetical protein
VAISNQICGIQKVRARLDNLYKFKCFSAFSQFLQKLRSFNLLFFQKGLKGALINEYYCIPAADGGYSNWTLSIPCNVSCGVGMEIWLRTCNNPEPKYGGRNCSSLGTRTEIKNCSTKPCPSKAKTLSKVKLLN